VARCWFMGLATSAASSAVSRVDHIIIRTLYDPIGGWVTACAGSGNRSLSSNFCPTRFVSCHVVLLLCCIGLFFFFQFFFNLFLSFIHDYPTTDLHFKGTYVHCSNTIYFVILHEIQLSRTSRRVYLPVDNAIRFWAEEMNAFSVWFIHQIRDWYINGSLLQYYLL